MPETLLQIGIKLGADHGGRDPIRNMLISDGILRVVHPKEPFTLLDGFL
jgi:hypothetical protein